MQSRNLSHGWLEFYQAIKDTDWPKIQTQDDLLNLPKHILNEVLFDHCLVDQQVVNSNDKTISSFKNSHFVELRANSDYYHRSTDLELNLIYKANTIDVHYAKQLDGYGTRYSKRYSEVISQLYPNRVFENCFEWCSGPGFIGFELLANKQCNNLYLSDIYGPAIKSIETTIEHNKDLCQDKVFYKQTKNVSELPTEWKFDFVAGNPPFFSLEYPTFHNALRLKNDFNLPQRKTIDHKWEIHQEFFSNIKKHLKDDGVILLVELASESGPEIFRPMIESNGMYINDCYWDDAPHPEVYYIEVKLSKENLHV